jgi:hypothetical protein
MRLAIHLRNFPRPDFHCDDCRDPLPRAFSEIPSRGLFEQRWTFWMIGIYQQTSSYPLGETLRYQRQGTTIL